MLVELRTLRVTLLARRRFAGLPGSANPFNRCLDANPKTLRRVTLAEMQAQLRAERGVSTGTTTLWRFFDARGLTFKKRVPTRPSRTGPTS